MKNSSRFKILSKPHGEGGFATILKGEDLFLERNVAIKKLKLLDDDESKERFKREAKLLAKMSFPTIPSIYDVDFSETEMNIYFEFIDGHSLRDIIDNDSYPSIKEAINWFSQVAKALDHAHSFNIIHRDVKPDNIIISNDRELAYLVDFGIALTPIDIERITKKGYIVGTPGYMSPEQEEGRPLSSASDIYSLGITLYEALSGKRPQPGGEINLSSENEAIPPAIDGLIKRCLQRDPRVRLSNSLEFIQLLKDSVRTDIPFSELLTEGRLHELCAGLSKMTEQEFHEKPLGQRLLIIARLQDLLRTTDSHLVDPAADMLEIIIRIAIYEENKHYEYIVDKGLEWGFDRHYGNYKIGKPDIRNSIMWAAKVNNEEAHNIIAKSFLAYVENINIEEKEKWYLHDLREIVKRLMANKYCDTYAVELADVYNDINKCS